jgi:hypothetical protein
VDTVSVVWFSVLSLGCAHTLNSQGLSNTVTFASKNRISFADSTRTYDMRCVSSYHGCEMNRLGITWALFSVAAWVCSNVKFACSESYCYFDQYERQNSCGFELFKVQWVCL